MITNEISLELIQEAIRHSEERMKFEYNRFGLSKEKRKSMILIGTIGQLLFKDFLESKNIVFEFEYQAGNYDAMDFAINNEIVEIKTSGYDNRGFKHLNLLYSEDQLQAGITKGFKYCVQIFVNGYNRSDKMLIPENCNSATIAGFVPFLDIKKYPSQRRFFGDDYKIPIRNLLSIQKLINND